MSANGRSNSAGSTGIPSDDDLAALANLLASQPSDEHADNDLTELLAHLDSADTLARRMEDNLDQLLERLDGMVEGLEASRPPQETGTIDDSPADSRVSNEKSSSAKDVEQQNALPEK